METYKTFSKYQVIIMYCQV